MANTKLTQTTKASAIKGLRNYHNFVPIAKLIFGLQHTVLLFCCVYNLILILSWIYTEKQLSLLIISTTKIFCKNKCVDAYMLYANTSSKFGWPLRMCEVGSKELLIVDYFVNDSG